MKPRGWFLLCWSLVAFLVAGPCLAKDSGPVVFAGPPKLVGPRTLALPLSSVDRFGNHLELPRESLTNPFWDQTPVAWFQLGYQGGPRGLQLIRCQDSCLKAGKALEKMGGLRALAKAAALGAAKVEAKEVKIHDFSDGRLQVTLPKRLLPRFLESFAGQLPPGWPKVQEIQTGWVTGQKTALLDLEKRFGQAGGIELPNPQPQANPGLARFWVQPYRSIEISGALLGSADFRTALARSLPPDHPLRRSPKGALTVLEGTARTGPFPKELKVKDPGLNQELAQFQRALAQQGQSLGFVLSHPAPAVEVVVVQPPAPAPQRDRLVFSSLGAALYLDAVLVTSEAQQNQYEPDQLDLWFADLNMHTAPRGKTLPQVERALKRTWPEGENWLLLPLPEGPVTGPLTLRLELEKQERSFVLNLRPPDLDYLAGKNDLWTAQEKALAAKTEAQDWPGALAVIQPVLAELNRDKARQAEPVASTWRLWAARIKLELGDPKGAEEELERLTQDYPLTEAAQEGWGLLLATRLSLKE
ncbi:MAG: hypothetical protein A2600_12615 [Candidatus Lambdaproteobacteria bacterium RIFOXYD1_FULL_56_27]|uniref:Uncharacterized protein n=1 Tax=Candidatus Lambdaproteobacteria bacterium RIFOXYD2_FULL_56_26 TaxID=1817773 RepID=A0A1F6GTY7_9PROT|nr:MAG: hypothetical protein A2426_12740 [Candidatus Lambdaproteobacteria bacterium RIFOXYC1_FULL_56_13]OGH01617.1 MAG: hypothetical protein A2557_00670 [Candidatus Lambdaproteobacteria bacterium RIFOXYD2_FULL_56_26]OGH07148.1 MAG: hypothetical protein A2600_12615 [Candidatus Lambdaproteobacteria bacterium RIFOXYD1_FULL_56_27]